MPVQSFRRRLDVAGDNVEGIGKWGEGMSEQPQYQVGDVVNGYRWNGQVWAPIRPPKTPWPVWLKILVAVLAAILTYYAVVMVLARGGSNERTVSRVELQKDAYFECKVAVLDLLKSPGSANFPMFDPSYVTGYDPQFKVRAYVDADNSFGASIRTPWECAASNTTAGWRIDYVTVLD